jgi:hypothetical protein
VGVVQALAEAVLERAEAGALEAAEAALELLAEQALAGREWAEAPKQFIARMVKRNLRPALAAWFGTPRIEGAWPGTAVCCLAAELTEHAFALAKGALRRKAGVAPDGGLLGAMSNSLR